MDSKSVERLLDAAVIIRQDPDDVDIAYMARNLIQATLPHKDPHNVPIWQRQNGNLKLVIIPHINRLTLQPEYPFGSLPRLILYWLTTEAVRTNNRRISLGGSLSNFIRDLGLDPRGSGGKRGSAKRVHSQMMRLFMSTISFEVAGGNSWLKMEVAAAGNVWWSPNKLNENPIWDGEILLGEAFFRAITDVPVPIDLRALRALKQSPLALDLYSFLSYTSFIASRKGKPRIVPWDALAEQMGSEYAILANFRSKALLAINKISVVYPGLRVESSPEKLIVLPASRSAIGPKA